MTPTKFSMEIERLVKTSNGLITYVEAVVTYCQENDIEIESVNKLLSSSLKQKLEVEAQDLNLLKVKSNKLPF